MSTPDEPNFLGDLQREEKRWAYPDLAGTLWAGLILLGLSATSGAADKEPLEPDEAPGELQDEDLMEMLDAGLTGIIVVDDYKAQIWSKVFPNLRLHREMAVSTDCEIGWRIRPDSPKLKAEIDAFAKAHKQGATFGNILVQRYVDKSQFVKSATNPKELEKFHRVVDLFRRYVSNIHKYYVAYKLVEEDEQERAKAREALQLGRGMK